MPPTEQKDDMLYMNFQKHQVNPAISVSGDKIGFLKIASLSLSLDLSIDLSIYYRYYWFNVLRRFNRAFLSKLKVKICIKLLVGCCWLSSYQDLYLYQVFV